jgi:hypothetical protein
MPKRLIHFRGTNDFARVNSRKGSGDYFTGGGATSGALIGSPLWISCNPSPFEQTVQGVRRVQFIHISNTNRGGMTLGGFALGIGGAIVGGLPGALVGVGIGAGMGSFESTITSQTMQTPKSFRRVAFEKIKTPCPKQDPLSFSEPTNTPASAPYVEPTFEEFKNLYPEYYGITPVTRSPRAHPQENRIHGEIQ